MLAGLGVRIEPGVDYGALVADGSEPFEQLAQALNKQHPGRFHVRRDDELVRIATPGIAV